MKWGARVLHVRSVPREDLAHRVKQFFADEKAQELRPPSEPPVPDAATKRLKTPRALAIQASSLLAKRQASAGVMREVAA